MPLGMSPHSADFFVALMVRMVLHEGIIGRFEPGACGRSQKAAVG